MKNNKKCLVINIYIINIKHFHSTSTNLSNNPVDFTTLINNTGELDLSRALVKVDKPIKELSNLDKSALKIEEYIKNNPSFRGTEQLESIEVVTNLWGLLKQIWTKIQESKMGVVAPTAVGLIYNLSGSCLPFSIEFMQNGIANKYFYLILPFNLFAFLYKKVGTSKGNSNRPKNTIKFIAILVICIFFIYVFDINMLIEWILINFKLKYIYILGAIATFFGLIYYILVYAAHKFFLSYPNFILKKTKVKKINKWLISLEKESKSNPENVKFQLIEYRKNIYVYIILIIIYIFLLNF